MSRTATAETIRTRYYVEPSGHVLADAFLAYWRQHEGRATLGYPVSEPFASAGGRVQFFERGALVAGCEGDCRTQVRRLPVGERLLRARYDPARTAAGRRVGTVPVQRAPSARSLDLLAERYRFLGGRKRFGAPLTEAQTIAGKTVRWYRYGRLEVEGDRVVVAPVGLELARAEEVATAAVPRRGLPELDEQRYPLFRGDGRLPPALDSFRPSRLRIPALGVDAAIERVAIVDGQMGEPVDPWRVGWYPGVAHPGEGTNVVLAGHRDWWGIGPTVFAGLDGLPTGATIHLLAADGAGFVYRVTASEVLPAKAHAREVVADSGIESLTLVTCTGTFSGGQYDARRVIRAVRV